MNFLATITFATALSLTTSASATDKTYRFTNECDYSFRYDSAKYAKERLDNTVKLIFFSLDEKSHFGLFSSDPGASTNFNLAKHDEDCANSIAAIQTLQFIDIDGADEYRNVLIEQTKDRCELTKVQMRGLSSPTVLREYKPAIQACSVFIDALEGKTDFTKFAQHEIENECKDNGSPAQCVRSGMEHPRLHIAGHSWYNCANRYTKENIDSETTKALYSKLSDNFNRLFKVKSKKCENTE